MKCNKSGSRMCIKFKLAYYDTLSDHDKNRIFESMEDRNILVDNLIFSNRC